MKIISKQPLAFLQNLTKSMGGVYVDNSKNRKLGRVGRPYDHKEDAKENEKSSEIEILVDKTKTLKNAKGKRLDAIIKYSNSAEKEGVKGIKVADDATDEEKKIAIAKFYKEAAEGDADNLDEIIEEALADYVPEKNK